MLSALQGVIRIRRPPLLLQLFPSDVLSGGPGQPMEGGSNRGSRDKHQDHSPTTSFSPTTTLARGPRHDEANSRRNPRPPEEATTPDDRTNRVPLSGAGQSWRLAPPLPGHFGVVALESFCFATSTSLSGCELGSCWSSRSGFVPFFQQFAGLAGQQPAPGGIRPTSLGLQPGLATANHPGQTLLLTLNSLENWRQESERV